MLIRIAKIFLAFCSRVCRTKFGMVTFIYQRMVTDYFPFAANRYTTVSDQIYLPRAHLFHAKNKRVNANTKLIPYLSSFCIADVH